MNKQHNFHFIIILVSIFILIGSFFLIDLTYGRILENYSEIKYARSIKENPSGLQYDIKALEKRLDALTTKLAKIEDLESPDLNHFEAIAKRHNLRLSEVNLKGKSNLSLSDKKGYTLVFTGGISNVLEALNYMENNLLMRFEYIKAGPDSKDNSVVNLEVSIILADKQ